MFKPELLLLFRQRRIVPIQVRHSVKPTSERLVDPKIQSGKGLWVWVARQVREMQVLF